MTYEQTIAYLYSLLPVFHRDGEKAFKGDLSNTIKFCEYLGDPHKKFKSIHIAGTNGKGSTSHFLASILQSSGYKTGLYTSPHLKEYTERFRINGISVAKQKIVNFVKKHKVFIEKLKPSFFELSVAFAFDYFAKEKVDIAIIEVGLGGRFDSTNVITPILSIITNIGFDHTNILGKTLDRIAFEKAGIIKPNIPVVISESHSLTKTVFTKKAKETNSEIYFAEDYFKAEEIKSSKFNLVVNIFHRNKKTSHFQLLYENVESQLFGIYQLKNLVGVFQAIQILQSFGFGITDNSFRNGLSFVIAQTGLKGRWQILNERPLTICDTGHNEHGLKIVLSQILKIKANKKYFILGFVNDKNVDEILNLFPSEGIYYFCEANTPRSMSSENLIKIAKSHNISGYSILNVNEALDFVTKIAKNDDFIYVGGSTFVVAELNNL